MTELTSAMLAASQEGDGGPVWLLALGPAGAGALYYGLWRYYRNTDKSHNFEQETRIEARPITGHDAKVNEITRTKETRIDSENGTDHRKRVQRTE